MIDYIIFKTYTFFKKRDEKLAKERTINFLVVFVTSLIYVLFFIVNGIFKFHKTPTTTNPHLKYYIGIPMYVIMYLLFRKYISKMIDIKGLSSLETRFKDNNAIPIWLIFSLPVILFILTPIIYGLINGTLNFPIFNK